MDSSHYRCEWCETERLKGAVVRILLSVLSAAALALLLVVSAPALGARLIRARSAQLNRAQPAVTDSHNFAGYIYDGVSYPNFTVTAKIVVPKLRCTKGRERAVDPSVGMSTKKSTSSRRHSSLAGLFVGCENGKANFFPNLEVNGSSHKYTDLRAKPADTIVLRVAESASSTAVSVVDKTHKFRASLKGAGRNKLLGPWVGDVGWYSPRLLGVPDFGTLHFSDSKLNGMAFASWGAMTGSGSTPVREDRVKHGATKIATSAFATDQESFTTTYQPT